MNPYEFWHGTKPSITHLHVFGCLAYALVPQQHCNKLDDKAVKCIFVGYSSKSKGYKLFHPQTKHILFSQDVEFMEDVVQPLLSCNKKADVSSCDMYDTLLPLFGGGSTNAVNHEAHHLPLQVSNESIDIHDVLYEERVENEARNMPK